MTWAKMLLLVCAAGLIGIFFYFELQHYFTLEMLQERKDQLGAYYEANRLLTAGLFLAIYVLIAALSLPGALIMTLTGGAIFGLMWGTILVSIASTTGATLAFMASRYLLGHSVQKKIKDKLETINRGIEREGAFYLFTLRLIPAFPFFVINLVMGLTPLSIRTFFFVSQLGMIPGTVVYVNAGTQLSQIQGLKGILSPSLLLSFVAIGLLPFVAKRIIKLVKKQSA